MHAILLKSTDDPVFRGLWDNDKNIVWEIFYFSMPPVLIKGSMGMQPFDRLISQWLTLDHPGTKVSNRVQSSFHRSG
jgi:hypothetical protein